MKTIPERIVGKLRINDFEINRTRNSTDSGSIGSQEFVSTTCRQFKHLFQFSQEKNPKPAKGFNLLHSWIAFFILLCAFKVTFFYTA